MANVRTLLEKSFSQFLRPAFKFREFWNKEPDAAHCFDMMELIFFLGGIRCKSTDRGVRLLWKFFQYLSWFQLLLGWLQMFEQLTYGDNVALQMWYSLVALACAVSVFNGFLINHYAESLNGIQNFICRQPMNSTDVEHDSGQRKKFYHFAVKCMKLIILFTISQQVVIMIANVQRDVRFKAPAMFTRFGPLVCSAVEFGFVFLYPVIWLCKYFACFGIFATFMIGIRAEMRILRQKFADLRDAVESRVKHRELNSQNRIEKLRSHADFWSVLKNDIAMVLQQHLELLKNFSIIKPFIGAAFMIRYYFLLSFIGTLLFMTFLMKSELWYIIICADVLMSLAEVFCWCCLIDSYQEVHQSIGEIAFDICTKLPYCPEHHLELVRTRTELIIIGMNACNGKPVKCGGIFVINIDVFVKLANTVYTVVTFLYDMEL